MNDYDLSNFKTLKIKSSELCNLFEVANEHWCLSWKIKYNESEMYLISQYNPLAIVRAILLIPIKILFEGLMSLRELGDEIKTFIEEYRTYADIYDIDDYNEHYEYLCSLKDIKKKDGSCWK